MRNFLANVERRRYDEHEESISTSKGSTLPKVRAIATRKELQAATQRRYSAALREAKAAALMGRFDIVDLWTAGLPPTWRERFRYWAVRHGVRWTS